MTYTLTSDVQEVIKKHLPEQLGETLRKQLEEGERAIKALDGSKRALREMEAEQKKLLNKIKELNEFTIKETDLKTLEARLSDRENKQTIFELKCRLEATELVNAKIIDFVNALMRNTEYRKNQFNGYLNNYPAPGEMPVKTSETVEETHG